MMSHPWNCAGSLWFCDWTTYYNYKKKPLLSDDYDIIHSLSDIYCSNPSRNIIFIEAILNGAIHY